MAFPYYPASYPYQAQMYQNQYIPQQQQHGGLIWVQGIEAAKSYPVNAGQSVLLMDSESDCFFIKSADASGMPLPLRVFDYTERNASKPHEQHNEPQIDVSGFITREEFESRINEILASKRNSDNNNRNDRGDRNNGK